MKKIILAIVATVIVISGVVGYRTLAMGNGTGQAKAALQQFLDEQVKEQDIPGMIMGVRLEDGTILYGTSGTVDPEGKIPWTKDTVSALGSITKTFTAVVAMQLVEEGKLSLDETVNKWFPDQPAGDRITVRMLLSHTSGLANYEDVFKEDIDKWEKEWTPEEIIAEVNKYGLVAEPGSDVANYSNVGYFMVGLIIEKVTGNTWENEVESRIITRLNMTHTLFLGDGVFGERMILGYAKTPDGYMNVTEFPWYPNWSTAWAAGAIVSSPSDLMTFATAFLDGELVSKESLRIMIEPLGKDNNDGIKLYGLGGATLEQFKGNGFGMGGDIPGYHAFFVGYTKSKHAVVAMVNTEESDVVFPGLAALDFISQ